MEKINENFVEPDISAICSIPIGRFIDDVWAWDPEKSGNFTVRSCYRLLVAQNYGTMQESSSGGQNDRRWQTLWKLSVPPKVRSFWWRVLNGFIPCRQILKYRHMDKISFCKICGAEESIYHSFFECTWARLFWEELRRMTNIKIPRLHPNSWASDLLEGKVVSMSEACAILCGCWSIWTERNAIWHNEGGRSIVGSVRWVLDTTFDLAQLGKKKGPKIGKTIARWSKPEEGSLKINVDASFMKGDNSGATGLIVRNSEGRMIQAQAIWTEYAASSLVMEAAAILEGVRFAIDRGFQCVEIESDAQEVINLIKDPGGGRSCIASIRQEIVELSGNFSKFKLSFVGRQANEAAHLCAKRASDSRRRCLWINYNPAFLADVLAKDCNPAD
jgi:ribonuclease HI